MKRTVPTATARSTPWRSVRRLVRVLLLSVLVALSASGAAAQGLPASSLSVRVDGDWRQIWSASDPPTEWRDAHPDMTHAVTWSRVTSGIERAEISIAGSGLTRRVRLVLVRFDPSKVELSLTSAVRDGGSLGAWSVAATPAEALLTFNAGQFRGGKPWGWLVQDGRELQAPGTGALTMGVAVSRSGAIRLLTPDSLAAVRLRGEAVEAFQSYPMLLSGSGMVPAQLRGPGRGVDVAHRDSRLALGQLWDGRILVVLTRFEGLGGALEALPFGPTTPEMAAIMGALGCESAVALDGGLSGQLLIREPGGRALTWPGMRRVPLGVVLRARA